MMEGFARRKDRMGVFDSYLNYFHLLWPVYRTFIYRLGKVMLLEKK